MSDAALPSQFREIMVRLQREYLAQLKDRLPVFRKMREQMQDDALPGDEFQRLYRLSHDFAGSGATFGFPGISRAARELYLAMKALIDARAEGAPSRAAKAQAAVLRHLGAFEKEIIAALDKSPQEAAAALEVPQTPVPAPEPESSDIYFLARDSAPLEPLAAQIRHFGYNVIMDPDGAALRPALERGGARAVVAFCDMTAENAARLEAACGKAAPQTGRAYPFIVVSPSGDFAARLAAARLGAQGFFEGEADPLHLIDKVEQLSAKFATPPRYNVMIVDDDRMLTELYNHSLTRAGMSVTTLTDPREVVDALDARQVDLILIDFSMPECNGQELASVIRQHERYVSLPIVFISAYEDLKKAIADTGLGIDDFLVKPFTAEQLFTVVRARARRAAELKAFMTRDSFTGLLNHTHFNETLDGEIARVRRGGKETCYALLDLDHFKSVNDTYGHAAGDQVIKSLARMLQQKLRRSDIIGRCGGEEFGVILPDCPLDKARGILDKIRDSFGQSVFSFNGQDVRVTLSGGIARVDARADLDTILKTADAALYTAKREGRNRICAE